VVCKSRRVLSKCGGLLFQIQDNLNMENKAAGKIKRTFPQADQPGQALVGSAALEPLDSLSSSFSSFFFQVEEEVVRNIDQRWRAHRAVYRSC